MMSVHTGIQDAKQSKPFPTYRLNKACSSLLDFVRNDNKMRVDDDLISQGDAIGRK